MNSYNNNTSSRNALDGTKTADNLMRAFEHEASAAMRADVYSGNANMHGDVSTRRLLNEISENGESLGELWLGYLDEIEDTVENLSRLSQIKQAMEEPFYSRMADIAEEEGFSEIAEKFRMASSVQSSHSSLINERVSNMQMHDSYPADTVHTCPVCGYTVTGNSRPDICPLCAREWS